MPQPDPVDAFLQRWTGVTGSERANYQLFIGDLCRLLGVPEPEPARDDTRDNAYVFERRVTFAHGDGSTTAGFIDCYRRGTFVLEAKKVKAAAATKGFDDALMRARAQAEGYARALPAAEGRPPFLVVVDVGHVLELYAEFTRSGATYTPFPDARSHRLKLADLRDEAVRERLRTLWLEPMALDPARASAKVTRDVAVQLAALARSLEQAGHSPEKSAAFLTRCLFSMFAEDVGLLPKDDAGQKPPAPCAGCAPSSRPVRAKASRPASRWRASPAKPPMPKKRRHPPPWRSPSPSGPGPPAWPSMSRPSAR